MMPAVPNVVGALPVEGTRTPGDIIGPFGDIVGNPPMYAVQVGEIYVTPAQAKAAARWGWERVKGVKGKDGRLVHIRRNLARRRTG